MKKVIFNKENPNGIVVEVENREPIERKPTDNERLEALEAAFMELVAEVYNG